MAPCAESLSLLCGPLRGGRISCGERMITWTPVAAQLRLRPKSDNCSLFTFYTQVKGGPPIVTPVYHCNLSPAGGSQARGQRKNWVMQWEKSCALHRLLMRGRGEESKGRKMLC